MLTVLNLSGYVGIQFAAGWLALLFGRRTTALSVSTGITTGCLLAIALYLAGVEIGGINIGLIALLVNLALVFGLGRLGRGTAPHTPIARTPAGHRAPTSSAQPAQHTTVNP
ncbi:hypothetical protein [Streptomyces cavernicola]|uniref:Sodium:solute symporter n=1 Tax=Streptomyces cavernicola TaxID=3043613 RepID=A0ABT6S5J4_9ACTN|nr:hypothetical protein [Streptomyces sp. B-S-A6]MDI3403179.1 hypothetical protein [Streptomyces sp. B-S-A6]